MTRRNLLVGYVMAMVSGKKPPVSTPYLGVVQRLRGRGYDDFVPGVVTKTALSGDRTA